MSSAEAYMQGYLSASGSIWTLRDRTLLRPGFLPTGGGSIVLQSVGTPCRFCLTRVQFSTGEAVNPYNTALTAGGSSGGDQCAS
ncbi:hypothetical protein FISHEDRAFT_74088 [Fistulina hepatica ATCC 64428]|uniref:Amidase domain-containing protein n=1 Tax=Fistulina hepatica ATCC 64428 TaxID=1128425 RepID=A0A0D7ABF9_9AGAR|nr:hypothetical protein FISHEDRAFT_74088 [Fistulina hepatica ATCC 64428]